MLSDHVEPQVDIAEGTLVEPVLVASNFCVVGADFVYGVLVVAELDAANLGEAIGKNAMQEVGWL